jgi:protein-tyrosine phosphatase
MEGSRTIATTVCFRVLFVCTANHCRSPIAERVAAMALDGHPAIVVESAGTHARPGTPMAPEAERALAQAGIRAGRFASRQLTAEIIRQADLILAVGREHRAWAASAVPGAADRAFTLTEFGALCAAVPAAEVVSHADAVQRARALVAAARPLRGLVPLDEPDLGDPYGRPFRAFRATVRRVQEALAGPLALLAGDAPAIPAGDHDPGRSAWWRVRARRWVIPRVWP